MRQDIRAAAWWTRAMKVVAFNGSPRPDGNTSILLNHVLQPLQAEGIAPKRKGFVHVVDNDGHMIDLFHFGHILLRSSDSSWVYKSDCHL